jgi:hypothetical protein
LVVEVINGRDKVVEELMGDKVVGEWKEGWDSREEDKGEETWERSFCFWGR